MPSRAEGRPLDVEVRPPWPYRLPGRGGGDRVMRARGRTITRLLHVEGHPIVVRAGQRRDGSVVLRAVHAATGPAGQEQLEIAIERMRFALGVDDDYREFYDTFRADPLVGPAVRRKSWTRPRRRPWPWEALAWAITSQLIDVPRASAIQRRMVFKWGPKLSWDGGWLRDVPCADVVAGRAPAELAAMDLAPRRALAMVKVAREVAKGRADIARADDDRRLLAISNIGPWTVQCLGLFGRGDPDALPAGDLGYIKLIGHLAGLGRRATVEEVEEFFAPYVPFRGLAGTFVLRAYHGIVASGPPLKLAA